MPAASVVSPIRRSSLLLVLAALTAVSATVSTSCSSSPESIKPNNTETSAATDFDSADTPKTDVVKQRATVGVIGHIDHGTKTLTAAILEAQAQQGLAEPRSYEDLAKGGSVSDETKAVTMSVARGDFATAARQYSIICFPRDVDVIKNLITGAVQLDGTILVVSANDGPLPPTKEHVRLTRQVGLPIVAVFLSKVDLVGDEDLLDLVEFEIREMLNKYGVPGDDIPIIRGSSLYAYQKPDDEEAIKCISELMDTIDEYIPQPAHEEDMPFLMAIEDVFSIEGRGTVATGRVERGIVRTGEEVEIVGLNDEPRRTTCTGVEMFRKILDEGKAGDNVGCLLRGIKRDEIERGQVLAKPGSITPHTKFEAELYCLSKEEGGRHTPFVSGYRPQFYFRTTDIAGRADLVDAEKCFPGDNVKLNVELDKPIAMEEYVRFAIREGGRIVGVGIVTKIVE